MKRLESPTSAITGITTVEAALDVVSQLVAARQVSNMHLRSLLSAARNLGMVEEPDHTKWETMIDRLDHQLQDLRITREEMTRLNISPDILDLHLGPQHEETESIRRGIVREVHRALHEMSARWVA